MKIFLEVELFDDFIVYFFMLFSNKFFYFSLNVKSKFVFFLGGEYVYLEMYILYVL